MTVIMMAFSKSIQPRKQRLARYIAPLHMRQKLVHAHISKEAREKLKITKRSTAVREGDKVKVLKGKFRGKTGKVSEVDLKGLKIYVEGVTARKAKGAEVLAPLEPSNVMIIELDLSDKRRKEILERKGVAAAGGPSKPGAPA